MEQREVEEPLSILLINQYAGSPTLGMEHRPHWMSQRWLESGNAVTVVAGSYSHLRRTNPQDVGMRSARDVDGVPFVWIGTSRYRGNGFARVLSMIEFGSMLDRRLGDSLVDAPDVVIASSTHPFDVRASWRLARKFGALFVMEIHDLWPLTPQRSRVFNWQRRSKPAAPRSLFCRCGSMSWGRPDSSCSLREK